MIEPRERRDNRDSRDKTLNFLRYWQTCVAIARVCGGASLTNRNEQRVADGGKELLNTISFPLLFLAKEMVSEKSPTSDHLRILQVCLMK